MRQFEMRQLEIRHFEIESTRNREGIGLGDNRLSGLNTALSVLEGGPKGNMAGRRTGRNRWKKNRGGIAGRKTGGNSWKKDRKERAGRKTGRKTGKE